MELRHLRSFVAVAEELHFGRAAERLHIAQPPLSMQIKQLEHELGVQLLIRSTRKVELTPAGASFLEHARAILAATDAAVEDARQTASGLAGRLVLGFTGSATYEVMPMLAQVLRHDLPGLDISLKGEMLTPLQVAGLLDHSLDIGFLRPPARDPGITVSILRREPLIAVLPDTHPLASAPSVRLGDLRNDPFITYLSQHRSVVYDAVIEACERAGFMPQQHTEVAETSTLVSFVASGQGVALVPASVQHLAVTGAVFRPLAGQTTEVALAVATRTDDPSPQVARVLARTYALLGGPH